MYESQDLWDTYELVLLEACECEDNPEKNKELALQRIAEFIKDYFARKLTNHVSRF